MDSTKSKMIVNQINPHSSCPQNPSRWLYLTAMKHWMLTMPKNISKRFYCRSTICCNMIRMLKHFFLPGRTRDFVLLKHHAELPGQLYDRAVPFEDDEKMKDIF